MYNLGLKYIFIKFFVVLTILLIAIIPFTKGQNSTFEDIFDIEYPEYFSQHDIVYKRPSYKGYEGFPIGNGDLGGLIWTTPTGIKLQINKSDAFDWQDEESAANLRSCGQLDIDFGAPCFEWLYLEDFDGRLSLFDANVSFSAETPFFKIIINSIVAVNDNVWIIDCEKQEKDNYLGGSPVKIGLERWGSRSFRSW
jgi:alpha-L-fucosidase 2